MIRADVDAAAVAVGERLPEVRLEIGYSTIAGLVAATWDYYPGHHDPEFASATRYGRVIASGTHTTALLLGLTASHFSKKGARAIAELVAARLLEVVPDLKAVLAK